MSPQPQVAQRHVQQDRPGHQLGDPDEDQVRAGGSAALTCSRSVCSSARPPLCRSRRPPRGHSVLPLDLLRKDTAVGHHAAPTPLQLAAGEAIDATAQRGLTPAVVGPGQRRFPALDLDLDCDGLSLAEISNLEARVDARPFEPQLRPAGWQVPEGETPGAVSRRRSRPADDARLRPADAGEGCVWAVRVLWASGPGPSDKGRYVNSDRQTALMKSVLSAVRSMADKSRLKCALSSTRSSFVLVPG